MSNTIFIIICPLDTTLPMLPLFSESDNLSKMSDDDNSDLSVDLEGAPIQPSIARTVSTYDNPGIPIEVKSANVSSGGPTWRDIIASFSPAWFTVCMGTGMASILLYFIPFKAGWLYYLSIVLFLLNVVLFCIISSLTVLRYCLFPKLWRTTLCDPMVAPFLGTIPIAFATLIEMWVFICVPLWGEWASTMIWAFWIVDAVGAVILTIYLSFLLTTQKKHVQIPHPLPRNGHRSPAPPPGIHNHRLRRRR
ncbi:voltage-dependent anion channel-domain-containing protein [Aspergillus pseudoustus]|uniref:Voltage-dependent anion channel-domain-containing protein n=1 Tax=Aspergillus pseudoustus TaxID=1810923 RepID=A0ABR4IBN3_9EURO